LKSFKINSEHIYFSEINEKALYIIALAYIQDLRLIKRIYKEAIKSKESLIRLSGAVFKGILRGLLTYLDIEK